MKMILEGYRIIDWTVYQAGPYAAAMLADMGADVIHLEQRGSGDLLRGITSSFGVRPFYPNGRSVHVEEHNRNKKSLALDLKKPQSKEIIKRLVEKSDVFMSNFRALAADKLGLNYKSLAAYNPRLIYASSSGYGRKGPDVNAPSLDVVAQARGGALMAMTGPDDPPTMGIPNVGDRGTSVLLAFTVVSALLARERFGFGQEVHVSQLGAMVLLQGYTVMLSLLTGKDMPPFYRAKPNNPLYNFYRCLDNRWIALGGFMAEEMWPPLCHEMSLSHLKDDPKFKNYDDRMKNSEELVKIFDREFLKKNSGEWLAIFKKADIFASPVNRLSDLASDPQITENNYIREWDHPILGKIKFVGLPYEFSQTPPSFRTPAPELGEHNEEILLDVCGYSWDEINELREKEVI